MLDTQVLVVILAGVLASAGCSRTPESELGLIIQIECEWFARDLARSAVMLENGREPGSAYGDLAMESRRRDAGPGAVFSLCLRTRRVEDHVRIEMQNRFGSLGEKLRETRDQAIAAQTLAEMADLASEVSKLPLKE